MKTIFALCAAFGLFASITAQATQPTADMLHITRALINNPSVVEALNKNGSPAMFDYEIKPGARGVNEYVLKFRRDCFCMKSDATVTISEDMSPTWSDGSPTYTSSITFQQ